MGRTVSGYADWLKNASLAGLNKKIAALQAGLSPPNLAGYALLQQPGFVNGQIGNSIQPTASFSGPATGIKIYNGLGSTNFNPTVATGDNAIIAGSAQNTNNSLFLGAWSTTAGGIRCTNTFTEIYGSNIWFANRPTYTISGVSQTPWDTGNLPSSRVTSLTALDTLNNTTPLSTQAWVQQWVTNQGFITGSSSGLDLTGYAKLLSPTFNNGAGAYSATPSATFVGSNSQIQIGTGLIATNYNPAVLAGDSAIISGTAADVNNGLVLAPWTANGVSIRMNSLGTKVKGSVDFDTLPTVSAGPLATQSWANTTFTSAATVSLNYLGLQGGTLTGPLAITGNAGTFRNFSFDTYVAAQSSNAPRWMFGADSGAENGGDAGSNFVCYPYSDNGTLNSKGFSINRASGIVDFGDIPTIDGVDVATQDWVTGQVELALPLTGGNLTGPLSIGLAGASWGTTPPFAISAGTGTAQFGLAYNGNFQLSSPAGQAVATYAQRNGVARWSWGVDGSAEAGSNVGSNFFINAYPDSGSGPVQALSINRSTGQASFIARPTFAGNTALDTGNFDITAFLLDFPSVGNVKAGAAASVLWGVTSARASQFKANFAGSFATCIAAATAPTVLSINVWQAPYTAPVTAGTLSFAAGSKVGVFASAGGAAVSLSAGTLFEVVVSTADTGNTLSGVSIQLSSSAA